ncbi:MAG: 4-(cytidine 5'-diphospho)-2-C-methyl-D-erythritol kinase [Burkholderiaceae bacterium]|jgi:4-diphosphocytidyl-2-C-methyl-D-erythritol kinase
MSADTLRLRVPAKINLFLHITGRRADGYHELQSVFAPIDWCDELALTADHSGTIRRIDGPTDIDPAADLTMRAARLLQPFAPPGVGATISLRKHIPTGAGLGGGSADAAYALLGLRALWQVPLADGELARLALELGADVPFFLQSSAALVEGIGERLRGLSLPERFLVLIKPDESLATRDVFRRLELTVAAEHVKMPVFGFATDAAAGERIWRYAGELGANDLQSAAESVCPAIGRAQRLLAASALQESPADFVRMSGSGSTVFAVFKSPIAARACFDTTVAALAASKDRQLAGAQVKLCRTLLRHSLADQTVQPAPYA